MNKTKSQLKQFLQEQNIAVFETEDGWELEFYSPAGEDYIMYLNGVDIEEILDSLEEYEFDPDEHAHDWCGANCGEPSSLRELLEDAEAIAHRIDEIKRKVYNFVNVQTTPISNRAGECPFCGNLTLEYGALETRDEDIYYPWTCTHCGASGRETYELSFAGHYQCVSPNGEYLEEIENN